MRHTRRRLPTIAYLIATCLTGFLTSTGFGQDEVQEAAPAAERSLADIAREARERRQKQGSGGISDRAREMIAAMNEGGAINDPAGYERRVAELMSKRDFEGLEKAAESARTSRQRFAGGAWLLFRFYEITSVPPTGRNSANDAWDAHFAMLGDWETAYPGSPTPKIAIAQAYLSYGGKARGGGYASTVTEEGWMIYGESGQLALAKLREAESMPAKDPYVYYAIAQLGGPLSMDAEQLVAVAEQAYKTDPLFYHTYRQVAYFLLPKWMGSPGDTLRFAEYMADKLGGDEGAFFYFEAASVAVCDCSPANSLMGFSWDKIQLGYSAMERMYGNSSLKQNRFAYMAWLAKDRVAAKRVFDVIGNTADLSVWQHPDKFQHARSWASE